MAGFLVCAVLFTLFDRGLTPEIGIKSRSGHPDNVGTNLSEDGSSTESANSDEEPMAASSPALTSEAAAATPQEDLAAAATPQEDSVDTPISSSSSTIRNRPIRVFCFGDSLTAGVSPPSRNRYPYATYVLSSLEEKGKDRPVTFQVDDAGYSGWMTNELLALMCTEEKHCPHHFASSVDSNVPGRSSRTQAAKDDPRNKLLEPDVPYDIFIFLAGTNDLGRTARTEFDIVSSILEMHTWAHTVAKIPVTMAIAIPSSAYQSRTPKAADKAARINQDLQDRLSVGKADTSHQTLFVPFPFSYSSEEKALWAMDGLHFSEKGYKALGDYLATFILQQIVT
ncbi:MAG: hypothetical protein SGILL_005039 [Bacillariaceae sp.]